MGWFIVFIAADSLTVEQLRGEIRAAIEIAMKGMLAASPALR